MNEIIESIMKWPILVGILVGILVILAIACIMIARIPTILS